MAPGEREQLAPEKLRAAVVEFLTLLAHVEQESGSEDVRNRVAKVVGAIQSRTFRPVEPDEASRRIDFQLELRNFYRAVLAMDEGKEEKLHPKGMANWLRTIIAKYDPPHAKELLAATDGRLLERLMLSADEIAETGDLKEGQRGTAQTAADFFTDDLFGAGGGLRKARKRVMEGQRIRPARWDTEMIPDDAGIDALGALFQILGYDAGSAERLACIVALAGVALSRDDADGEQIHSTIVREVMRLDFGLNRLSYRILGLADPEDE